MDATLLGVQTIDGITGIGVNITATALAHGSGHMFVACLSPLCL